MNQQDITLISFGYFRKDILEAIAREVKQQFLLPVQFREGHLDITEFYDSSRRQYNGNRLLKQVDAEFASDSTKTLGLFSVDLFIPILTYIFGQAAFRGRTGIASLYRLSNERYGIEPDDKLLLERFTKEVIHELGHTFGLVHCLNPSCVMRSSTYVEDIDQKEQHLCLSCREELSNTEAAKQV
jgi:archaemetzincin